MQVRPLTVGRKSGRFRLLEDLALALERNAAKLEHGDVVAVSSKYVALSQGRIIRLEDVRAYPDGRSVARRFRMHEGFAEVVQRESDAIIGGIPGFAMATVDGILAPNAGIDRSNSGGGAVLYPSEPYGTAEELKRGVFLRYAVNVGVIIVDSRLMPARGGTVGVAIGCAGIEPVNDMRAQRDLDGNPLRVTVQAAADGLAAAANHAMGEGSESRPYAVISGSGAKMTARRVASGETAVPHDQCVYVRGLAVQF